MNCSSNDLLSLVSSRVVLSYETGEKVYHLIFG